MATTKKAKTKEEGIAVTLPEVDIRQIQISIIGMTPLIMNRWSEKSIREIEEKQAGLVKTSKKEPRNPQREYEDSIYRTPDGKYAFPSSAFKKSAVEAVRQLEGLTMVETKTLFHVLHEFVEIKGQPRMRRDMRRLKSGTYDPVYRAEFPEWSCVLDVRYNASRLSLEQLMTLFMLAGMGGVGGFRASGPDGKSGSFGMFKIAGS